MKMNELLQEQGKRVALYYDYTGAGRGPEMIAGPFPNVKAAQVHAKEQKWSLKGGDYFIDNYRPSMDK